MNLLASIFNPDTRFCQTVYDPQVRAYWCHMHTPSHNSPRPCFHPDLMRELRAVQQTVTNLERHGGDDPAFFVLASQAEVFNLGGDLSLFCAAIRSADRDRLREYARLCCEGVHHYHCGFGTHVHSIALVQGAALGGGFEAALSCNTIIAEADARFALPEVLFDLFPGMGAYPFLRRRIGGRLAEKLILSGRQYGAEELHEMGVVDRLVPAGEGPRAVDAYISEQRKHRRARRAMDTMRRMGEPVSLDEVLEITELWVETALGLDEKSLRTMERFVRAQERRYGSGANAQSTHEQSLVPASAA